MLDYEACSEPAGPGNPAKPPASPATPINRDQFNARLDFNETAKSAWFARFSWTTENTDTQRTFTSLRFSRPVRPVHTCQHAHVSPTKVNEVRFGITAFHNSTTTGMGANPTAPWALDWSNYWACPAF